MRVSLTPEIRAFLINSNIVPSLSGLSPSFMTKSTGEGENMGDAVLPVHLGLDATGFMNVL